MTISTKAPPIIPKDVGSSTHDQYSNTYSITTIANQNIATSVSKFLNDSGIITTANQTTDINARKKNTLDDAKAQTLAEEAIDFSISDTDGTFDINQLIIVMNYICASLDTASISTFLNKVSALLKEINNSLEEDNKIDLTPIKNYFTTSQTGDFGTLTTALTADNVYGSDKTTYAGLFTDTPAPAPAEEKETISSIKLYSGGNSLNIDDYKKMQPYGTDGKKRVQHVDAFIAENNLFPENQTAAQQQKDIDALALAIIDQIKDDPNPTNLLGLYLGEIPDYLKDRGIYLFHKTGYTLENFANDFGTRLGYHAKKILLPERVKLDEIRKVVYGGEAVEQSDITSYENFEQEFTKPTEEIDFSGFKRMQPYESNGSDKRKHISTFISDNGLFGSESHETNSLDVERLVVGIIEQVMNYDYFSSAELIGDYINEFIAYLETEMPNRNKPEIINQVYIQFGRYAGEFLKDDTTAFQTLNDKITKWFIKEAYQDDINNIWVDEVRNITNQDQLNAFKLGWDHASELTDGKSENSEIITQKHNVTQQKSISDYLSANNIIPTDKQTIDINDRKRNSLTSETLGTVAQAVIDTSKINDKVDINTLITNMNYVCASLDGDSIALFAVHIGKLLETVLSEDERTILTDYFIGGDKAPTSENGFGKLKDTLTSFNVYGNHAVLFSTAILAPVENVDDVKASLETKNKNIDTAKTKTTSTDVYDALKMSVTDENGAEIEGVSSEVLREFVVEKLCEQDPTLTDAEKDKLSFVLQGLIPPIGDLIELEGVKEMLKNIEYSLFFNDDIWTDVAVETKITLSNNEDFSEYTKMPEYYSNGGSRKDHMRNFISSNNLFTDPSKNELDLEKIVIGIIEQAGQENGNPSELLGLYINELILLLPEKGINIDKNKIYETFGKYAGAYNQNTDPAFFSSVIDIANLDKDSTGKASFERGLATSVKLIDGTQGKVEYWGNKEIFEPTGTDYGDTETSAEKRKRRWNIAKKVMKSVFIGDTPGEMALNIGLLCVGIFSLGVGMGAYISKLAVASAAVVRTLSVVSKGSKIYKATQTANSSALLVGSSASLYYALDAHNQYKKTKDPMSLIGLVGLIGVAGLGSIAYGASRGAKGVDNKIDDLVSNNNNIDNTPIDSTGSAGTKIGDDTSVGGDVTSPPLPPSPLPPPPASKTRKNDSKLETIPEEGLNDIPDEIISTGTSQQQIQLIKGADDTTLSETNIDKLIKNGDTDIHQALINNKNIKLSEDNINAILLGSVDDGVLLDLVKSKQTLTSTHIDSLLAAGTDNKISLELIKSRPQELTQTHIDTLIAKGDDTINSALLNAQYITPTNEQTVELIKQKDVSPAPTPPAPPKTNDPETIFFTSKNSTSDTPTQRMFDSTTASINKLLGQIYTVSARQVEAFAKVTKENFSKSNLSASQKTEATTLLNRIKSLASTGGQALQGAFNALKTKMAGWTIGENFSQAFKNMGDETNTLWNSAKQTMPTKQQIGDFVTKQKANIANLKLPDSVKTPVINLLDEIQKGGKTVTANTIENLKKFWTLIQNLASSSLTKGKQWLDEYNINKIVNGSDAGKIDELLFDTGKYPSIKKHIDDLINNLTKYKKEGISVDDQFIKLIKSRGTELSDDHIKKLLKLNDPKINEVFIDHYDDVLSTHIDELIRSNDNMINLTLKENIFYNKLTPEQKKMIDDNQPKETGSTQKTINLADIDNADSNTFTPEELDQLLKHDDDNLIMAIYNAVLENSSIILQPKHIDILIRNGDDLVLDKLQARLDITLTKQQKLDFNGRIQTIIQTKINNNSEIKKMLDDLKNNLDETSKQDLEDFITGKKNLISANTKTQISKAYRKLSIKYHPDKVEGNQEYIQLLNNLRDDLEKIITL